MEKIKNLVLRKIKPTREESEKMKDFVIELLRVAETVTKTQPIITGSIGKGTWLKGDCDIDLFLMFPKSVSRKSLEKRGIEYGEKITYALKGRCKIRYAEHPYVRATVNGIKIDIVPCYKIGKGDKIISAVDRSPLHVAYILEKLDPEFRDDARLLKQFCKGIGIYGSDAKNLGVSGYICELLVIKYGRFESVLKAVSKLNPGHIIDIENLWFRDLTRIDKSTEEIKNKFRGEPLIIIDPVDKNRNAAAALSCENFMRFVNKAREFLKNPSMNFFFPVKKELSKKEIKSLQQRKTKFFGILFDKPDVMDDILYPQLRKASERLASLMAHHEFRALRKYEFVTGKKVALIFEMETWLLPFIEKMVGPPVFAIKNSRDFLKKYKNCLYGPYIEKQNWVIEKQRKFKMAHLLLRRFLSDGPENLQKNGVPNHIAKPISNAKILQHDEFWEFVKKNKEFSAFLREKYFENQSTSQN